MMTTYVKETTILKTLISVCKYGTIGTAMNGLYQAEQRDYVWNTLAGLGMVRKEIRIVPTDKGREVAEAIAPLFQVHPPRKSKVGGPAVA